MSKKHYGIYVSKDSPLIDKLDSIDSVSAKLLEIITDYFNGKFDMAESEDIDTKIKRQKYLKLCLENWNMLKHSHIEEEAKSIILGKRELATPTLQTAFREKEKSFESTNKFDLDPYCQDCQHEHYGYGTSHLCRICNCGIRG